MKKMDEPQQVLNELCLKIYKINKIVKNIFRDVFRTNN